MTLQLVGSGLLLFGVFFLTAGVLGRGWILFPTDRSKTKGSRQD